MRSWEDKWPPVRPRWGTFSVESHIDLRSLITDVLLYDALVFPVPVDEPDFKRWEKEGWQPDLLEFRIIQLGDAAFATPWDSGLRAIWSKEYQQQVKDFSDDPTLAFDLTAAIMAEQSFARLVGPKDDRMDLITRDPPEIHPVFAERDVRARLRTGDAQVELVAAFQSVRQAHRITGAVRDEEAGPQPHDVGVRLRLQLAVPEDVDEETFYRVLDLIGDEDFQAARRRLWSWENLVGADELDEKDAQLALDGLINDYNAAVDRSVKKTRLETVFLLLPAAIGAGADALITGGLASLIAGLAVSYGAKEVRAKFPVLGAAGAPVGHHPGSAVNGAVSVLAHD